MTRLLFICPNLKTGGAERQWSLLLPGLAERGFDVGVITLDGEGPFFDELRQAGIDASCALMRRRSDLAGLRRARAAASPRPDVVVTLSVSALIIGHALARRAGAAHVSNEHADYAFLPLRRYQRALTRLIAPRVDAAVAVAQAQLPALRAHGFRPARLHVIPNGVSAEDLVPTRRREAVRSELGLAPDDFVAVLVAGLRPEKRPADFVAAVTRAHTAAPRIRGVVVGGGELFGEVFAAAEASGGAVQALGFRSDIANLVSASDVICLTSLSEAFPMTLLEGMALERPVVATAVGGVPELVEQGRTGLLVPPRDPVVFAEALTRLVADPVRATAMGRAGFERQRRLYTLERMVDSYAEFLASLVALGGRDAESPAQARTVARSRGTRAS
ncbi:MAG: glycosyltransferase [Gaiellaceae bacterium]|jgi:glycosyltransferase involved in cell wall biosynthesis